MATVLRLPLALLVLAAVLLGGCCSNDSAGLDDPTYTRWITVHNETQGDIEVVWHHEEWAWPCKVWTEERTSIHPGQKKQIDLSERCYGAQYAVWHFVAWQDGIDAQFDVRWLDDEAHVRPDNFRPRAVN